MTVLTKPHSGQAPTILFEIVVPIGRDGKIFGEIDIDSDAPNAFTASDQHLLESVAELLAPRI
jgi:putative methionine-R-sulfoxide reductase with GAF domain